MEKNTTIGLLLLVVSALVFMILLAYQLQTLIESIAEILLIAIGATATLGLQKLFSPKSTLEKNPYYDSTDVELIKKVITNKIQEIPDFSYLVIHYSRKKDNAKNHNAPYYIVNYKTKKAYWVREELIILNSRAIVHSNGHDSKEELMKYLSDRDIELIAEYSKLGDLGEVT
jgi:hypothetical protein